LCTISRLRVLVVSRCDMSWGEECTWESLLLLLLLLL
jgi:hypothetical protein